jgi:hypothetical protein
MNAGLSRPVTKPGKFGPGSTCQQTNRTLAEFRHLYQRFA